MLLSLTGVLPAAQSSLRVSLFLSMSVSCLFFLVQPCILSVSPPLSGHRNEYVCLSAIDGRTDRRLESSAFQMPIASALQPFRLLPRGTFLFPMQNY